MRQLTRAERYKRNYRLIKNAYQDTTLAKASQTWSDSRLYEDLGIKVTKSIPKLKKVSKDKKPYYTRKLNKFLYARSQGLDVKQARKMRAYRNIKIDSTADYYDIKDKRAVPTTNKKKIDLWKTWSSNSNKNFPPEIEKRAKQHNKDFIFKARPDARLDENNEYGFIVEYYFFTREGISREEIDSMLDPDLHDQYKHYYRVEVRAT